MNNDASAPAPGAPEFEEWFLGRVSTENVAVEELLQAVAGVAQQDRVAEADGWAELLEEALTEQGRADGVIRVLKLRAEWHPGSAPFRAYCEKKLTALFRNDLTRRKFVAGAGFDRTLPLPECFRRLELLQKLASGVLCLDKTWGFGVIARVDAFYERVTIDFDGKRGHELSFAYAAEALQLVGEDHLLARKHRDPAGFTGLVQTNPAEIVRITLRSYGPTTAGRLQELLTGPVLKPDEWKGFWEAARRALKEDPLVVMPAKRSEPIELLATAKRYDREWFEAFAAERSEERIFRRLEELADNVAADDIDAGARRMVGERLAFLIHGLGDRDARVLARAALAAETWQVEPSACDRQAAAQRLLAPEAFAAATAGVTARQAGHLIRFLAQRDPARLVQLLVDKLPEMTSGVLGEAVDFLLERGDEGRCQEAFKEIIGRRVASVEILYWLARRPERTSAWLGITLGDLAFLILNALEKSYSGEHLRAANQLAELLQQREWLEAALRAMTELQRTSFLTSVKNAAGRIPVDTQAMIARMILCYPTLAEIMRPKATEEGADRPRGGVTSWRSYRRRQQQMDKLVNEDIPNNSRDIAHARGYGDLSENFEYKSAKEQQRILMRRQEELEEQLRSVKGSDFASFPTDIAGIGTHVVLEFADQTRTEYCVLGEWDQDAQLGIIACSSRMGQLLDGHRPGDEVRVPGEQGDVACRIAEVGPLPEHIRAWVRGTDAPA